MPWQYAKQPHNLFIIWVLQQVCAVLQLKEGQFHFDEDESMPTREMTELSVPATEAMLMGLRMLSSWDALADQVPAPNEALTSIIPGQLNYRLDELELQVWKYANQAVSLQELAQLLKLPIEKVQQIAFRLRAVGFVAVRKETYG